MRWPFEKIRHRLDAIYRDGPYFSRVKASLMAAFGALLLGLLPLNMVKVFWLQPPHYGDRILGAAIIWLATALAMRRLFQGRLLAAGNLISAAIVVPLNFGLLLPRVPVEPVGTAVSMFIFGIVGLLAALTFASRRVAAGLLLVQVLGQIGIYSWGLSVTPLPGTLQFTSDALLRDGELALCIIFFLGVLTLRMLETAQQRSEEAWRAMQALNQNLGQLVAERTQKLQRLNDEKDLILGLAAHDLRAPAAKIRMLAEAVEVEGDFSEQRLRSALAAAGETATRQLELLDQMLDVSKIEDGKTAFTLTPLDLRKVLEEAHADFGPRAAAKGLTLILAPASEDAVVARLDAGAIRQVVDNLVSNALKFSSSGKRVWLSAEPRPGGVVRLSVRDEGPGLSATDRAKLFVKFSRLSARPTAGERSTGLGLFIVKRLVDCMAGTVDVDSEPGCGATFRVELPAA